MLSQLFNTLQLKALALTCEPCAACGLTLFLRLAEDETAVRCVRCRATPVHLAVIQAMVATMGRNIGLLSVYEMSSRGPLLDFLRKRCGAVTTSEYFPDVSPGSFVGGVISEDVQQLTFSDATFDVCTSTEVFEHVPDDMAGFRELVRVLKPGGCFIFTVPLTGALVTVERCTFVDGQLTHLHPPAYHGDRLNGAKSVLVFRDYGEDVVSRLVTAGFQTARLVKSSRTYFGYARTAIIAITPPA